MKKLSTTIIILFILLFSGNLFSDGEGVTGELIFNPNNLGSQTYSIMVTTSEYCWLWDNIEQKTIFLSTYNFQRSGLTQSTAFDEPKDENEANLGTIPWGLMDFSITSGSQTLDFTLDLRDLGWSQNTNKYWTHDTYINFDFTVGSGIVFLSQGGAKNIYDSEDPKQMAITSSTQAIWSFWSPNSNPQQSNFKVPVTLYNKIEDDPNNSFGYLIANNNSVGSGDYGLFLHDVNQTVSEGTLDTIINSQRY
ncbi:MAG: hypothetical protein COW08_02820 [Ignavibacteriales bacterium CG12_big_fil_rev_8_21_14_0_65_30_8]|nr:MAG: hypothetical protein COW08_02820 [Ignavibacteriales bacterium CG12_big_fil_rev_8_21_14_0_65_30_8]